MGIRKKKVAYVEDEGERKSCEKYAEMKGQEGLEGGEGGEGCARL